MKKEFEKRELQRLETIEQSWSGDELKIETENMRVWLNLSFDCFETFINIFDINLTHFV